MALIERMPDSAPELDERGQAVIEYILLLVVVVGFFLSVASFFSNIGLGQKLAKPITGDFAHAYQLGDPKAKSLDDGAPERHPRVYDEGPENFRIFINPDQKGGS